MGSTKQLQRPEKNLFVFIWWKWFSLSPPLCAPPAGHQYSGMQLCLVWKCKSPFVAIIYGLRRLSRVFSALVHYYTITVHGLLTPLSALTGFLKGYATSLPYQCGWGPANVLISHLVPFHSKRRRIAQIQKKRGETSNANLVEKYKALKRNQDIHTEPLCEVWEVQRSPLLLFSEMCPNKNRV